MSNAAAFVLYLVLLFIAIGCSSLLGSALHFSPQGHSALIAGTGVIVGGLGLLARFSPRRGDET